jgi:uncharacterized protein YprB with RNaseH-like and TPR domain
LTQKEYRDRERFRCQHGHNGNRHPACYLAKEGGEPKIGFADIEASNLTATFGIVYTYCIKELDGKLIERAISLEDLHTGKFDKNLIARFIDDASQFTHLIWHYGTDRRFDMPFLRTRAVMWGLPFPEHKCLFVGDTYPILRNKFKLHSNRLETACDFFGIPAKEHKLNPSIWLDMITGNKKRMQRAISYILTHNKEDVISLEKLWKKISKFTQLGKRSL